MYIIAAVPLSLFLYHSLSLSLCLYAVTKTTTDHNSGSRLQVRHSSVVRNLNPHPETAPVAVVGRAPWVIRFGGL